MNSRGKTRAQKRFRLLQNNLCILCGKSLVRPTFEHLRSKYDGGTKAVDNLALSCQACNNNRGHAPLSAEQELRVVALKMSVMFHIFALIGEREMERYRQQSNRYYYDYQLLNMSTNTNS